MAQQPPRLPALRVPRLRLAPAGPERRRDPAAGARRGGLERDPGAVRRTAAGAGGRKPMKLLLVALIVLAAVLKLLQDRLGGAAYTVMLVIVVGVPIAA